MPRGQGYDTPMRKVRVDEPLWEDFGGACATAKLDRSKVIRDLMAWYARHPGAKLPKRPIPHADDRATHGGALTTSA
jgi:hypothetical protein